MWVTGTPERHDGEQRDHRQPVFSGSTTSNSYNAIIHFGNDIGATASARLRPPRSRARGSSSQLCCSGSAATPSRTTATGSGSCNQTPPAPTALHHRTTTSTTTRSLQRHRLQRHDRMGRDGATTPARTTPSSATPTTSAAPSRALHLGRPTTPSISFPTPQWRAKDKTPPEHSPPAAKPAVGGTARAILGPRPHLTAENFQLDFGGAFAHAERPGPAHGRGDVGRGWGRRGAARRLPRKYPFPRACKLVERGLRVVPCETAFAPPTGAARATPARDRRRHRPPRLRVGDRMNPRRPEPVPLDPQRGAPRGRRGKPSAAVEAGAPASAAATTACDDLGTSPSAARPARAPRAVGEGRPGKATEARGRRRLVGIMFKGAVTEHLRMHPRRRRRGARKVAPEWST